MRDFIGAFTIFTLGALNFLYWAQPVDIGLRTPFANYNNLTLSQEERVARIRCSILKDFNENSKLTASQLREIRRCYRNGRLP